MNIPKIHHEANLLIAATYGTTSIPEKGSVVVNVDGELYRAYFQKVETGWIVIKTEAL